MTQRTQVTPDPAGPVHWGVSSCRFVVYVGADPVFSPPSDDLPRQALLWIAAALEGEAVELGQNGKRLADREALLRGATAMLEAWRELRFSQSASVPAIAPDRR